MDNKKIIGVFIVVGLLIAFLVNAKKKKEKEEEEERLRLANENGEEIPCVVLTVEEWQQKRNDQYWWLRRAPESYRIEAYAKFKKDSDGLKKIPSYYRWADDKMIRDNFCVEGV